MGRRIEDVYKISVEDDVSGLSTIETAIDGLGASLDNLDTDSSDLSKSSGTLSKKLDNLGSSFDDGKSDASQYATELKSTETRVSGLETDFDNLGTSIDDVSTDLGQSESALGDFKSAALGAAAGIAAMGILDILKDQISGVVTEFAEFNNEMKLFQARTGATTDEMDGFRQSVLNVFEAGFGDGFEDVGAAMARVHNLTGLTGDELERATTKALTLQQVFDADINETTRTANQLMRQFGIDSDEAFDIIGAGLRDDAQGDFLDTLNEYSAKFADAGLSAQEAYGIIQAGNEAGIFATDKLGDAVNEFAIRTLDMTDKTKSAYDDLIAQSEDWVIVNTDGTETIIASYDDLATGLSDGSVDIADAIDFVGESLTDIEDPLERNRLAVDLIGTLYEDFGDDITTAFANADDSITDVTGTIDDMQSATNDPFLNFRRGIEADLITAMDEAKSYAIDEFLPDLITTVEWFKTDALPILVEFGEWFIDEGIPALQDFVEDGLDKLVPILEDVVDAVEPMIKSFGEFIKDNPQLLRQIGQAVIIFGALTGVVLLAGTVIGLLVSPVLLVIAAIVAFTAAYESNFLGFGDAVDTMVAKAKQGIDLLVSLFSGIKDAFDAGGLEGAGQFILDKVINPMVSAVTDYFNGQAATDFGNFLSKVWDAIKLGASTLVALGGEFKTALIDPIVQAAKDYFANDAETDFGSFLSGIWAVIKLGVSKIPDLGGEFKTALIDPMIAALVLYATGGGLAEDMEAFGALVKDTMKNAVKFGEDGMQWVLDNLVEPMITALTTWIISGQALIDMETFATGVIDTIKTAIDFTEDAGQFVLDNILNPFLTGLTGLDLTGIATEAAKMGASVMTGIGDGISDGIAALELIFKNAINSIIPDDIGIDIGTITFGIPPFSKDINFGSVSVPIPDPFRAGGFTGFGGVDEPAGTVHGREFVVPAHGAVVKPTPSGLQLQGSNSGGNAGNGANGMMELTIINQIDGREVSRSVKKYDARNPQNPAIRRVNSFGFGGV